MRKIYEARDSLQAHFVRTLLASSDIRAEVLGESLAIAWGELPLTSESVWVNPEDLDKALQIVKDFEKKQ